MTIGTETQAETLARFATMGPDWYPGESDEIADSAIVNALAFLDAVQEPRMTVHPMLNGGVQVEIHRDGRDIEFEFHPDDHVEFCYDQTDPPADAEGWAVSPDSALRWWRRYWLEERDDS